MTLIEFFSYAMATLPQGNANNFAFLCILTVQNEIDDKQYRRIEQECRRIYGKISEDLTKHKGSTCI